MPGTPTPNLNLPIPASTDSPDVPGWINQLAQKLDSLIGNISTTTAVSFASPCANADATNAPSLAIRFGKSVSTFLNITPGSGSLSSGSSNNLIGVLPAGFRPQSYAAGRLEIVNAGAYQNTSIPVQINGDGSIIVKAGTVPTGYSAIGTIDYPSA